jgi:hypothetical protein
MAKESAEAPKQKMESSKRREQLQKEEEDKEA